MKKWFQLPVTRFALIILAVAAAGAVIFPQSFARVFEPVGMPHSHCYLDDPRMIWLHVVSDLFIGLAYVSISTTLAYLVYRARQDIPFHWMILAFGLFIVSCGFTHFMEVWTVWKPVYWLAGYVKVVTAVASVIDGGGAVSTGAEGVPTGDDGESIGGAAGEAGGGEPGTGGVCVHDFS